MERKKNQTKQYSPNELLIPRGSLAQYLGQYGFEGKGIIVKH
jgi:5-formaminoimidazole-4-carboxamide-1-beta-D-ribofuranosyl 5'-monophosphate synthetase